MDLVSRNVTAQNGVIAATAEHDIAGWVVPCDEVVAGSGHYNVPASHATDPVVTCSAEHHVVTCAGVEDCHLPATGQDVVAVAAIYGVVCRCGHLWCPVRHDAAFE
jgi:hypothetical protein